MNLYDKVDNIIMDWGVPYSNWCCGVSSNPHCSLFDGHGVNKGAGFWISEDAGSPPAALLLKAYFLQKGCQESTRGGISDSQFLYLYLITPSTRQ